MKRATLFAVTAAVAAVAACGNKQDKPHDGSGAIADNKDDPTEAPPPPVVKPGGKGDCKTDYAPLPKRDPNPMCKIDGGTFTMGDDNERMAAKVSPYFIDQFEVTAAQVAYYLNATNGRLACDGMKMDAEACFQINAKEFFDTENYHYIVKKAGRYVVAPGYERYPYVNARRGAAASYCAWAGKRLPTEAQWEFAGRHDPAANKDLLFPWGDTLDPARFRCDPLTCKVAPSYEYTPVGTYDGTNGHGDGRSPWGVFDLAGNASEAVLGCVNDYHPCNGPCVDPPGEPARKNQPCGRNSRGRSSASPTHPDRLMTTREEDELTGIRCVR